MYYIRSASEADEERPRRLLKYASRPSSALRQEPRLIEGTSRCEVASHSLLPLLCCLHATGRAFDSSKKTPKKSCAAAKQAAITCRFIDMSTLQDERDYASFFRDATGFDPYWWQIRVALDGLPQVIPVPTGLGKTEGSSLAWAWRRFERGIESEPLHLVYCLPMRSLVRQSVERLKGCFKNLAVKRPFPEVTVYQLMGGTIDKKWAESPDRPWVLVGTQDQLLSRALNRGYAMSRYQWPVHFGLLNQNCHWLVDEIQLMGPGLWTTSQLDWMRRKRFTMIKDCRTTWMSATVGLGFLATTDRKKDGLDKETPFDPDILKNSTDELRYRIAARRPVEWFTPSKADKGGSTTHTEVAREASKQHREGTLTLIICNTVEAAQSIFRLLPSDQPKILLTSRFRPIDRRGAEQRLLEFEAQRAEGARGKIACGPGLLCVSTQVVEAGLDISAHRLWSELAPWPSVIQRLGRLNRDGRDDDARAYFWRPTKDQERKHGDNTFVGPYLQSQLRDAGVLMDELLEPSARVALTDALDLLDPALVGKVLEPVPTPLPRALDVHGLFSTEPDLHGGFTDVSPFVRNSDPDSDLTVFWRKWQGEAPPVLAELDGPAYDPAEGCAVAFYRLRETLQDSQCSPWTWEDETGRWQRTAPSRLRPGMLIMLQRQSGGYDPELGWTGQRNDVLADVPRAGRLRSLQDDERTELGYWSKISTHLRDARSEAENICDELLPINSVELKSYRAAVVEAAALHDLGKAHPKWQAALPAKNSASNEPLAKCPHVLGVDVAEVNGGLLKVVESVCPGALRLSDERKPANVIRLRWAVDQKLKRSELSRLREQIGVRWAGYVPFRPRMRHEAASALAMWYRYRSGNPTYPVLAVYLAAAHHGKVRTVLRSITKNGDDVFGVEHQPDAVAANGTNWPLDFSIALDGADGQWRGNEFIVTDFGWTGLVADLLGSWKGVKEAPLTFPVDEPHSLGPFALAWLEALVRVADARASEAPSQSTKPSQVSS